MKFVWRASPDARAGRPQNCSKFVGNDSIGIHTMDCCGSNGGSGLLVCRWCSSLISSISASNDLQILHMMLLSQTTCSPGNSYIAWWKFSGCFRSFYWSDALRVRLVCLCWCFGIQACLFWCFGSSTGVSADAFGVQLVSFMMLGTLYWCLFWCFYWSPNWNLFQFGWKFCITARCGAPVTLAISIFSKDSSRRTRPMIACS